MSKTLLEISEDLLALMVALEESAGEVTPELEAWFDTLGTERDKKLDCYAALIREFELCSKARKEESDRMAALAQADANAARRLKDRLKLFLEVQRETRIDTARYRITLAKNGGALPVDVAVKPEDLPAYQKRTVVADIDALRKALEAGVEIGGARLKERGTHVRIA